MKPSREDGNQKKLKLLKQAKRGNDAAQTKLRGMGLLYWEHAGRVIVKRVCANNHERHGAVPWSLSDRSF